MSNADNGDQTADFSGDGIDAPTEPFATLTPDSKTFPDTTVGDHVDRDLVLQNTGTGSLTGIALGTTGSQFGIQGDDCPSSLDAGDSCTITVRFAPTSTGDKSGSLRVTSDNAVNGTVEAPLSGKGVAAPAAVAIEPDSYDFGQVDSGATRSHTFVVHNTGGTTVRVTSLRKVSGSSAFSIPGLSDHCSGRYVGPGATCSFRVTFTAAAAGGSKVAHIEARGIGFETTSLVVTGQTLPFTAKVDAYISTDAAHSDPVGKGIFCSAACDEQTVEQRGPQGHDRHLPGEGQERR